MSKLYLLTQDVSTGYDTYDSAVVCAKNEQEAVTINPGGFYKCQDDNWYFQYTNGTETKQDDGTWAKPSKVTAELLGTATKDVEAGTVICSSFNAG